MPAHKLPDDERERRRLEARARYRMSEKYRRAAREYARARRATETAAAKRVRLAKRRAAPKPPITAEQRANAKARRATWARRHAEHDRLYSRLTQHNMLGRGRVVPSEWLSILEAFEHRCAYCGVRDTMTIDHVIPLSRGGRNEPGNLVPACGSCNHVKGRHGPLVMVNRAFALRDAWNRKAA